MAHSIPQLSWQAFTAPKSGSTLEELEDAAGGDAQRGRFAIADGATESAFAATWAKLLVEQYVQGAECQKVWLSSARQQWLAACQRTGMPWYLEEKVADGAHATFMGVSFLAQNQWNATAIGDACLFHIRDKRLELAFPVLRSESFGSRPALLWSRSRGTTTDTADKELLFLASEWRTPDILLLATDALAQWFLRQAELGGAPWRDCVALQDQQDFDDWMRALRDSSAIRNDDVTLLVIRSAG